MPGKLGRKPSDPVRLRRMIRLRLTGVLPTYPITADHLSAVARWMLGGNNTFGTCGPTAIANFLVLTYKALAHEDITVTDDDVFDLYRRSGNPRFDPTTGADDNGVDMTVMLDALLKGGIWITHADGRRELVKPICYAAVDTDPETQRAVTSFAGATLWGADMQIAQQSGQTWDYRAGSGAWGGHAIPGGRYTSRASAGQVDESVVSWKEIFGTTVAWVTHQLAESYLTIFPILWEHPDFQVGVDRPALAAAYEAATGRPFPAPVDPPNPPEPPTPQKKGCLGPLGRLVATLQGYTTLQEHTP